MNCVFVGCKRRLPWSWEQSFLSEVKPEKILIVQPDSVTMQEEDHIDTTTTLWNMKHSDGIHLAAGHQNEPTATFCSWGT